MSWCPGIGVIWSLSDWLRTSVTKIIVYASKSEAKLYKKDIILNFMTALKVFIKGPKGCLGLVPLEIVHLVVPCGMFNFSQDFGTCKCIKEVINKG